MAFLTGVPRWAWIALGAALLVVAFLVERNAYGNRQFKAGETATDAKWQAASEKLKEQAAASATKADDAAAERLETFVEQQTADQEAIDEAVRNGSSPFDGLFN